MKESLTGETKKTSRKGLGIMATALLGCAAIAAVLGGYEATQLSS